MFHVLTNFDLKPGVTPDELRRFQFELGFEILPGTRAEEPAEAKANPFEQRPPAVNTITD